MVKKILAGKYLLIATVCLVSVFSCPNTSGAYEGTYDKDKDQNYYYGNSSRGPICYGPKGAVSAPPVGAIVKNLPVGFRTETGLGGPALLYSYKKTYFKACSKGFIVVASEAPMPAKGSTSAAIAPATVSTIPAAAANSQNSLGEQEVVNIPNSDGSFTPVRLSKKKNGYIGPQGEYYPGHPTISQLKTLYGK